MLYKMTEWQSQTGKWHCNCVENLAGNGGYWAHPARILGMELSAYVKWVIDTYNPEVYYNEEKCLVFFSWSNQAQMRKFKNYINAAARKVNYQI